MADGDLYLSDSPNVDKGFVEQDGQLRGVKLQAVPDGTLVLSNSANVSSGYVTDTDGKKHKVNLVATVEGTLELPDAPNADTGYVVDGDGKKHKVQLTATLYGGGSAPVIDELNVTPSTSAQVITAPEGTDGYSPVNVAAVTSSIDANIVAGNIKKDVSILGVTGSYEGVAPSGTKSITTNGTHNVADYEYADVQVPTTAPDYYIEFTKDANNRLQKENTVIDLTGVTDLGDNALMYSYYGTSFPANTDIDMSGLTKISGVKACHFMFSTASNTRSIDMSSVTEIAGQDACSQMFRDNTSLQSADLSSLEIVSNSGCAFMFYGCTNLSSVNLSSLKYLTNPNSSVTNMFTNCKALTSLNLGSLIKVTAVNAFSSFASGCSHLATLDLSSLTELSGGNTIMNNAFPNCTSLTTVSFYSLKNVTSGQALRLCFSGCTSLSSLYFYALRSNSFGSAVNQLDSIVKNITGCTIHFPKNLDPNNGSTVISGLSTYPLFGGISTVLAFDLPSTFVLTGANAVQYERNPKYDTATALSWRVLDTEVTTTPYYTSGTTDPQVGATIYSDSACTQVITSISSVA